MSTHVGDSAEKILVKDMNILLTLKCKRGIDGGKLGRGSTQPQTRHVVADIGAFCPRRALKKKTKWGGTYI